jgi:membrane-associated protein
MMQTLSDWIHKLRDVSALVQALGYFGLTALVFVETGLLIGFFLPGDSVLVAAGLLASKGYINVYLLGALLTAAAIVGDTVGYHIGKASGPRLFTREDSLLFNKKHLIRAHEFYERHGGKTIVIARFMPIVRTFAPVVAGMAGMTYMRFIAYNVVGAFVWVWSMLFTGYFLGQYVPGIDKHIDVVIVIVIFLSILPAIIGRFTSEKTS